MNKIKTWVYNNIGWMNTIGYGILSVVGLVILAK